jgi:hypothetical protein
MEWFFIKRKKQAQIESNDVNIFALSHTKFLLSPLLLDPSPTGRFTLSAKSARSLSTPVEALNIAKRI